MSVLSIYLQVGLALLLSRFAWELLRVAVMERRDGPSASLASRLAQGLLVFSLVLPILVLALPELGRSPRIEPTSVGTSAAAAALEVASGFVLLGEGAGAWLAPEIAAALPALAWALLLPFAAVAAWRTGVQWLQLRRLLSEAECIRSLGRVRVLVTDDISTPFSTAALGRAHVVLPRALLERGGDSKLVLRHELHHHRRRDVHWALLLDALRVLFAWNPAVHSWARELSDWQERACDAELIERGAPVRAYAGCLLRVAEDSLQAPFPVASAAMARPNGHCALKRRIEMLIETRHGSGKLGARGTALVFALATVLTTSAWAAATALPGAPVVPARAGSASVDRPAQLVAVPSPTETALRVGSLAPDLEFRDGRGEGTRLSELRGQVVVLDFWADWCRFCNEAVPSLRALEKELGDEDLAIVGVSVDTERAAFDRFLDKHQLSWPQLHASDGMKGRTASSYGIRALPMHVVIDRDGRIAASGVRLAQLRPTIEALLDRRPLGLER